MNGIFFKKKKSNSGQKIGGEKKMEMETKMKKNQKTYRDDEWK